MRKVTAGLILLLAAAACQTVPASGLSTRQVAVLKQLGFRQMGANWELGLADRLLFPFDSDEMAPAQRERLGRVAGALAAVDIVGARIEGHTDSTGSSTYNVALSQRRAGAVKAAIVAGGLADGAVRASGLGEAAPVESNATATGRQENRRVVVIVSPQDVAARR